MKKKSNKAAPKTKNTIKGVNDADWGSSGAGVQSAFTVQALRAIDNALDPKDAYQLSVDVRSAVHARAQPVSQGKVRMFMRKSGDEVVSGDLYNRIKNPCPAMSESAFLYELCSWYHLAGEMVVGSIYAERDIPEGIYPLNPFRLSVIDPLPAKHLAAVKKWRYAWGDGVQVEYSADQIVLDKNFNPQSNVRGCIPILAGVNEISSAYEAFAYNRRFFSNNAEPSHIVNLPNVTDPKEIETFKAEYIANYSIRTGNSHRVMFVGGSDVSIQTVGEGVKEGSYLSLVEMTTDRVMRLYKVPPIHGGVYSKTIALSMSEQNKVFAETAIMPDAERMSQYLQMIVDRFFLGKTVPTTRSVKMSKSLAEKFEKAKGERPDSEVIVVLDIDHLPIISDLKSQKLEYAQKFASTFKVSPFAAAEEIGVEIEPNEANQQVWHLSTEQVYTSTPAVEEVAPVVADDPEPEVDDDVVAEKRQMGRTIVRSYRKAVLERLEEGKSVKLNEADLFNTISDESIKQQFRFDYLAIKRLMEEGGDVKASVKEYLNKTYNRNFFKKVGK